MVEWYRRDADYQQIATDVEQLVAHVASTYSGHLTVQDPHGVSVDLTPPWPQWTIADAMAEFAGIHLGHPGRRNIFGQVRLELGHEMPLALHALATHRRFLMGPREYPFPHKWLGAYA